MISVFSDISKAYNLITIDNIRKAVFFSCILALKYNLYPTSINKSIKVDLISSQNKDYDDRLLWLKPKYKQIVESTT